MTRLPEREANSRPALSLDTCQPTRTGQRADFPPRSRPSADLGVAVARNAIRMGDAVRRLGSRWQELALRRLPRECHLLMLAEHGRDAVLGACVDGSELVLFGYQPDPGREVTT
jgi:hypothetical protein